MSNPSKQRGTMAESALVKYLHSLGVEDAKRQPLSGNKDIGDVLSHNGSVVWEVKNYSGPASVGQPPQGQLDKWMDQTDVERTNAGARIPVLVVKRKGTTDVGKWFAYLYLEDVGDLLDGYRHSLPVSLLDAPICMSVASVVELIQAGTPDKP